MGKILIIDDEKQMLALLSRILELEGYEVYRAATCKAGLRQLQVNTQEVVLRDVCLPDGNGIELIDRMKNISPSAEIILLTAHGKIEDSVSAIKSSAFDYLVKGDDNNTNGRATIISQLQGVGDAMIEEGKLTACTVAESSVYKADGDSAWFEIDCIDKDSAEHIYLMYAFRFSTQE